MTKAFEVGTQVGTLRPFTAQPMLLGKEITLTLPSGVTHRGQFAIVDLDDILASHNEQTFASTEGFPVYQGANANDRNYATDKNAQAHVISIAQDLRADRLITTDRGPHGSPIITPDGIVVSGNGRTMGLKLAVASNEAAYAAYKTYLLEEAEAFGFRPTWVAGAISGREFGRPMNTKYPAHAPTRLQFKHPVLVRLDYDFPAYTPAEFAAFNVDTRKGETPIDRSIRLASQLQAHARCQEGFAELLGSVDTFSEFYGNANLVHRLRDLLYDCGVLYANEFSTYLSETGLTDAGKDLVEQAAAGLLLGRKALIASDSDGVRSLRKILIVCLPVLLKNASLGEFSIREALNLAVLMQREIVTSATYSGNAGSDEAFRSTLSTFSLTNDRPAYTREAYYLNRLLQAGQRAFKQAVEHLNESGSDRQPGLFGPPPSFREVFDAHVVQKIDPATAAFIERLSTPEAAPLPSAPAAAPTTLPEPMTPEPTETAPVAPLATAAPADLVSVVDMHDQPVGNLVLTSRGLRPVIEPEPVTANVALDVAAPAVATDEPGELCNGSFYEANPGHILGTLKQVSARFGGGAQVVVGTLSDAMSRIPFELGTTTDVAQTVVAAPVALVAKQNKPNLKRAIASTQENLVKALGQPAAPAPATTAAEVYSFAESLRLLNAHRTEDHIRCFCWHKKLDGDPLRGQWSGLYDLNPSESDIHRWLDAGIVAFDGTRYYYAPLFYSGLAHQKELELEHNHAVIVAQLGEQRAQQQKDELARRRPKPFTLSEPEKSHRLILRATSKFAKEFSIKELRGQPPFERGVYHKGKYDKFSKLVGYEPETLALPAAFVRWMDELPSSAFVEGVNAMNVASYYVHDATPTNESKSKEGEAKAMRLKSKARLAGERLFSIFLETALTAFDQRRLETQWNNEYNSYITVPFDEIPVAFRFAKTLKGEMLEVRPEKREAVAHLAAEGAMICAYDVGVGKTFAAIFAIAQALDSGYCSRPVIVTPNQVYRQFVTEVRNLLPHVPINEYYNLGADKTFEVTGSLDGRQAARVPAGSITVLTEEGFERLGFNYRTQGVLIDELFKILNQGEMSNRETGALKARLETLMGRGLKDTLYDLEDFGFDFLCCDEAHSMKKIFSEVRGATKGDGQRETHSYEIKSGSPSSYGLRGFMLSQYIQRSNRGRNVLLLTATPFTNSPLEVYSMLSLVASGKLKDQGVYNLRDFFDTYVSVSEQLVITPSLKAAYKQVVMGFSNLSSLQALIRRYINYKTADDVGAPRPNKIVLPLLNRREGDGLIQLPPDERIETRLPLSGLQESLMNQVTAYIDGFLKLDDLCSLSPSSALGDAEKDASDGAAILAEKAMTEEEKTGVRILRGINFARNIALSPYLYPCANLGLPTYKEYVETSPKLSYIMGCIQAVRQAALANKENVPGQIIYMDRGVSFFPLLRDYLVFECGFKAEEVGMIYSGLSAERKDTVKNRFLGIRRDPATGQEERLPEAERMKVLIGSSTIKEGMNLQLWGGYLYNAFVDWNPTDVKQLEGRIWRYGNQYESCVIVNPLMENSIEPFIFQKLQEKTSRINEIWSRPGRLNDLKLEEFNPAELKNALITDPERLAMGILSDQARALQDQASFVRSRAEEAEKYVANLAEYDKQLENFRVYMSGLTRYVLFGYEQPLAEGQTRRPVPDFATLAFETMYSYYYDVVRNDRVRDDTRFKGMEILRRLHNRLPAAKIRVLDANKLALEDVSDYVERLDAEAAALEANASSLTYPDHVAALTKEIEDDRRRNQQEVRSQLERVDEFTRVIPRIRLKQKAVTAPVAAPVSAVVDAPMGPPRDKQGNLLVDAESLAKLAHTIALQPQTKTLNVDAQGNYTPERQALHKRIIEKFTNNRPCRQEAPIAVLTGGLPGSGKSHLVKNSPYAWINDEHLVEHVDADAVRAEFPEYQGWNAAATHAETKDVVSALLTSIGTPCAHDLVYDGTMNKISSYLPLIERLNKYGYRTFVLFVKVPLEVSKQRVLARYQKTGRYVPLEVIEEAYHAGDTAFRQITQLVNGYIVYDGETGKELERGGESIPTTRSAGPSVASAAPQPALSSNTSRKLALAQAAAAAAAARLRILTLRAKANRAKRPTV